MSFIVQVSKRSGNMEPTPSAIQSSLPVPTEEAAEAECSEIVEVLQIGGYHVIERGAAFDQDSPDSLQIDPHSTVLDGRGEQLEVRWFEQEVKSE